MSYFVVVVVESSVTVVYPRSDQSSTGGLDDLNSLLCVQRGLESKRMGRERGVSDAPPFVVLRLLTVSVTAIKGVACGIG